MAFCPVCKGNHDPDVLCVDSVGRALKDMGIKENKKRSKKEFSEIGKGARRSLVTLGLILFGIFVLVLIYILTHSVAK